MGDNGDGFLDPQNCMRVSVCDVIYMQEKVFGYLQSLELSDRQVAVSRRKGFLRGR